MEDKGCLSKVYADSSQGQPPTSDDKLLSSSWYKKGKCLPKGKLMLLLGTEGEGRELPCIH